MKKIVALSLMLSTTAVVADTFTFISPQKPGAGTSQWTDIVVKELQKHMPNDTLKVRYFPGARDIPAINAFQDELRFDNNNIVVSHGGNGVSFLQEPTAKYQYGDWDSVGMMNLNIINAKTKGIQYPLNKVTFAASSGRVPDAMAMTLLLCGPNKSIEQYKDCFKDKVKWIKGMKNGERRIAFKRGELNADRENPAAYKKHILPNGDKELWFHHGLLQKDGSHADDPNFPGYQLEILFEKKWGVKPEGRFYNAYKLVKSFRDSLQKAMWVNKGNPNRQKLVDALTKMSQDPASIKAIQKKVGKYEWIIGDKGNAQRDTLMTFVSEQALKDLVKFSDIALDVNSKVKEELYK